MKNHFGRSVNTVVIPEFSEELLVTAVRNAESGFQFTQDIERNKAIDLYENKNLDEYVGEWFSPSTLKKSILSMPKVVPRFARNRMMIYKSPPERLINGAVNEDYQRMTPMLNTRAREFSELAWLLSDSAVLSEWNEKRQALNHYVLTDYTWYFVDGEQEPMGVSYPLGKDSSENQVFAFWSEERNGVAGLHFQFKSNGVPVAVGDNVRMVNPYGVLPVSSGQFLANAYDVVNAAIRFAVLDTEVGIAHRLSLGQPVAKGISSEQATKMMMGMDSLLGLPADGDLDYKSPGVDLEKMIIVAKSVLDVASANNHMRIKWAESGGDAPSGEALKIMEIENLEARQSDIPVFKMWESDRYKSDRAIIEAHTTIRLDKDYTVNFAEVEFPKSAQEEREGWQWKLDSGLHGVEEYYTSHDPDITKTQLDKKVADYWERQGKIKDINAVKNPLEGILG